MPLWSYNSEKWTTVDLHKKTNNLSGFICGGGPSLSFIDPRYISGPNRIVIGLNNTYPRIRPDIWVGMDDAECYDSSLFWEPFPKVLRGNYGDHIHRGFVLKEMNSTYFADVVENDDDMAMFDIHENTKFVWRKNTLHFALQFSMWLGIKDIYLFGVDLDNSKVDYFDGTYLSQHQRDLNSLLYDQLYTFLGWFKEKTEPMGITVRSCSQGSRINSLFEYVHYLDAIRRLECDVPHGRLKMHVLDKEEAK